MAQVAAVYLVVAWLTMQVVDVIAIPLRLPEWFPTVIIVFLAIGFPIALIISWAFNVTPDGVVRETETAQSPSGRTIEFVLIGLVAVAVVWLLYRTEFSDVPQTEPQIAEETAPDVLPNSIAVLPFANLSPDPDNAFFAAGIHDTILNELAKIGDMHVISRTAMMRYADGVTSIPQVAEELRVGTVMEGSVQYANGRVLVTAQLIDPKTNSHLWSENYDREFADIFDIQADIATQIAVAMQAQLSTEERLSILDQMTESPEAYAFYLQAMETRPSLNIGPATSSDEFHRLLDVAIQLDPLFARAYATKAFAYSFQPTYEHLTLELAAKARTIDPELGLTYVAIATAHNSKRQIDEARRNFDRAYELMPNDYEILDEYARFLTANGDDELAIEIARKVSRLSPGAGLLGNIQWWAGRHQESADAFRQAIQNQPNDWYLRLNLAFIEAILGNERSAQSELGIAMGLIDIDSMSFNDLAQNLQKMRFSGLHDESGRFQRRLEQEIAGASPSAFHPIHLARAYVGLGNDDEALKWLDAAADQMESGNKLQFVVSMVQNIYDDPVLERPEFVAVRKRIGYVAPGSAGIQ